MAAVSTALHKASLCVCMCASIRVSVSVLPPPRLSSLRGSWPAI